MQDADEAVAELAKCGAVVGAAGAELGVVGPRAGGGFERVGRVEIERVGEPAIADMAGQHRAGLAGLRE